MKQVDECSDFREDIHFGLNISNVPEWYALGHSGEGLFYILSIYRRRFNLLDVLKKWAFRSHFIYIFFSPLVSR